MDVESAAGASQWQRALSVLVVEDDDFQRAAMIALVQGIGVGTVHAERSAMAALRQLDAQHYDIVICDLKMRHGDGLDFIRSVPRANIGGLVISSAMDSEVQHAANSIAQARGLHTVIVPKPVSKAGIFQALASLVTAVDNGKSSRQLPPRQTYTPGKAALLAALSGGQIVPYFQPQIDLRTGNVVGFEILARWENAAEGLLMPSFFVPLIEEVGLIDMLSESLWRTGLAQACLWKDAGFTVGLSMNMSASTLAQPGGAQAILGLALESGIAPNLLVIELTESVLATDSLALLENMARLRMHGLSLSMDDLGTGYASLRRLSAIPFVEAKLDRSLLEGALKDQKKRTIIASICHLVHGLNMRLVAEGIETAEELAFIRALKFELGQGYLFSRALPAMQVLPWLQGFVPHNASPVPAASSTSRSLK